MTITEISREIAPHPTSLSMCIKNNNFLSKEIDLKKSNKRYILEKIELLQNEVIEIENYIYDFIENNNIKKTKFSELLIKKNIYKHSSGFIQYYRSGIFLDNGFIHNINRLEKLRPIKEVIKNLNEENIKKLQFKNDYNSFRNNEYHKKNKA